MWPWTHLAIAYLVYSACSRLVWRRPPVAREAVVVAVASQIPDLVDKSLAWWLAVLPAGRSLAHSLLFAVPLISIGVLVGWLLDERPAALALAVGYATHLAMDVVYPLIVKGELRLGFLLWPLVPAASEGTDNAFPHIWELFNDFIAFLATPRGVLYFAGDATLMAILIVVWAIDGFPGFPALVRSGNG